MALFQRRSDPTESEQAPVVLMTDAQLDRLALITTTVQNAVDELKRSRIALEKATVEFRKAAKR